MRKTSNITVAVAKSKYRTARLYAARRGVSMSAMVEFFFDNLHLLSKTIRNLLAEDPNFGFDPIQLPGEQKIGLTAKFENRK